MLSRLIPALLAGGCILWNGVARAEEAGVVPVGHKVKVVAEAACAAPCCAPCEKHLEHIDVKLYETQELVTVPNINIKEVVTRVPIKAMEVDYKEEKRSITIMVEKEREEERLVTSTTCVPEITIDPCTGCQCTTYKNVDVCKVVKIKVWDVCPETKEYTVKVPVLKCVDRELEVLQLTATATSTAATCTKLNAAITRSQMTVPAPPCPAIPCLPIRECQPGCCGGTCGLGHK